MTVTGAAAAVIAGLLPLATNAAAAPESAPATVTKAGALAGSSGVDDGSVSEEDRALGEARSSGVAVEVVSARTELSDEWADPDGSFAVRRYGSPVRVFRGGVWVAADPSLVFAGDGSVVPRAVSVAVVFSGGGTGPLLSGVKDGRTLTLSWPSALPVPVLEGNVATYADVLPGVDVRLKAEVEGFSQLIVVKSAAAARNPALATLRYTMSTVGLSVASDADTGSITATDPAGQTVFTSPTPLMWDSTTQTSGTTGTAAAKSARARAGTLAAGDAGGVFEPPPGARDAQMATSVSGSTLSITPDQALLTGAGTQYPVYIDPSWAWGKRQNWTRVYKKYPTTSFWNANEVARVGYEAETNGLSRSFFQWDISNIENAGVISSTFRIKNTWSWSCQARPVQLWQTGPITSRTTWNNQPAKIGSSPLATVDQSKGWGSACPAGNLEFDLTPRIRDAAAHANASVTLGLYAADESDTYGWKKFDPKTAVLETTYNHAPTAPADPGTNPRTSCGAGGLIGNTTVSLHATIDDRDAGNLTARFQVFPAGSTTPVVNTTVPALKGRVATLVVPDSSLPTGTYTWKANATDAMNATSPWSATCTFTVDRTRPARPPLINSTVFPPGDNGWPTTTGTARQPAPFSFAANGVTDVAKYYYFTDWDPSPRDKEVTPGAGTSVTLTPPGAGPHFVYAYSADSSGNVSDTATYLFYAAGSGVRDVPGDLNGDGNDDIWNIDVNGALLTYAGQGNGQFASASNGGGSFSGARLTYRGDWGQDGYNDLIALQPNATGTAKNLWEYPNNGSGIATVAGVDGGKQPLTVACPAVTAPTDDNPDGCATGDDHWHDADQIIAPGDLNGDGAPDLLVKEGTLLWAYYGDRATKRLDIHGDPVLVGGADWNKYTVIAPGDINNDGYPDLFLREDTTGDLYRAYGGPGEQSGVVNPATWGSPDARVKIGSGFPAATYPVIESVGDLTGDGVADLWGRRSDNALLGWPGATTGTGGFSFGAGFPISATSPVGAPGGTPGRPDMSGDGLADMVVQTPDGTLSIRRKISGNQFFDTGTQVSWGWQDYFGQPGQGVLYFADIDGDGTKDLIALDTDGNITVRRNNRTGTAFDSGTLMSSHWSNFLGQPGQGRLYFADVTGDGKADLIVLGTDGDLTVRKNMGTYFDSGTLMSSHWSNFLGQSGQGRLYFADVTGDGKADLIVLGTDGDLTVRKNMGTYFDSGTLMSSHWSNFLGQPGQGKLYFADVTGDGKADLVVHETDGAVSYRVNLGTYFDAGREASAHWSNFLGGPGKGLLYFE
ncbi:MULTISPECIES: FG-GAP-like repeat-containing protein [unclassified Streptomyces]|uniref:FG-GAP-like repeat-containing protein n=1 Tax=unclassified Streptomyces TaxID=2593676 RepID=UPI002E29EF0A|nr:FG-GAP-like repeat-containing protein [Streptomyces sp. NBC_00223]